MAGVFVFAAARPLFIYSFLINFFPEFIAFPLVYLTIFDCELF